MHRASSSPASPPGKYTRRAPSSATSSSRASRWRRWWESWSACRPTSLPAWCRSKRSRAFHPLPGPEAPGRLLGRPKTWCAAALRLDSQNRLRYAAVHKRSGSWRLARTTEQPMSENKTQQVTNAVEKVISEQASRLESAVSEMNKLQSKGLEQVNALVENVSRAAKEQIAFAEQMGGECRKLVLAATKNATELFAPKA